ncbi:hypothetical protein [Acanthopleuribacter pedis]|uniref:Uncharacterized protein n=1 Tax=Acanthopleuribacter pedis TaxID=442870 RepID=A0A8J7Q957_9BACT|nr:hypothetical protein [Acanthopleuribacter pedis]MBO1320190.1 hypothetical protein [Acanthopleuribacter pedis]
MSLFWIIHGLWLGVLKKVVAGFVADQKERWVGGKMLPLLSGFDGMKRNKKSRPEGRLFMRESDGV